MGVDLTKVVVRSGLKPKREPYWIRLNRGCTLGFRKMTTDSVGTWIARYRDPDSGKRPKQPLGEFEELPPSERYGAAKAAAERWFAHLGAGGSSEVVTVAMACQDYVEHIRAEKGSEQAKDLQDRLARWVLKEPIADVPLQKLTRKQVEKWRTKLKLTPVIENPHAEQKDQRTHARSSSSLNREMTGIRAALNYAKKLNQVASDLAWREALKPVEDATNSRDVYLNRQQRKALIDAAPPDFAGFLTALCLMPLRPGAMAKLTGEKFASELGVLSVGKDKGKKKRKVLLPTATAAFFNELAQGRPPDCALLTRADGKGWDRHTWKKALQETIAQIAARPAPEDRVSFPKNTVVMSLRHSVITDLVVGGLDLFTVAKLAGTSVEMIEDHYAHLQQDTAAQALAKLAL